jgi:hypothetical protein
MRRVLHLAAAAVLGCTTTSAIPSSPTSCPAAVIALCQAACSCGTTDASRACSLGNYVDGAGGGGASWASASACETYFAFACSEAGSATAFNYTACDNALSLATCVSTVNGPALLIPAACSLALPDGGVDSAK